MRPTRRDPALTFIARRRQPHGRGFFLQATGPRPAGPPPWKAPCAVDISPPRRWQVLRDETMFAFYPPICVHRASCEFSLRQIKKPHFPQRTREMGHPNALLAGYRPKPSAIVLTIVPLASSSLTAHT